MSAAKAPTSVTVANGRSPFKLLDSYSEKDRAIFFGRELEIDTLYRLLGESPLVLVYGPSGTGKTSVIQCGLTRKFSPTNWLPVMVRRGDDINAALLNAIAAQAITPIKAGTTLTEAIRSIYLDHLRPIYLIFDQFEELYVLGSSSEQERFYGAVREILTSDVACRMIVSLREEYLGALDRFEQVIPTLYDKKLRVEAMSNSNVEKVILGTVSAFGITLEHGEATARKIIAQISDNHSRVQLAYLQVYLDYLYRKDIADGSPVPVEFSDAEVEAAGKLGDIMAEFLQSQERSIQAELEERNLGIAKGGIARLLEEFVSVEGTKQPTTFDQLLDRIPAAEPWAQIALDALVNGRLLRLGDGRYELAHDALAVHIDDRRSGDEKQLLRVEKLVTNRFAESAQTNSLLNAAELALVDQGRKQIDPFDGSPRLRFDDATEKFISQSQRHRRRWFIQLVAAAVLAILIPLGGGVAYFAVSQDAALSEKQAALTAKQRDIAVQESNLSRKNAAIAEQARKFAEKEAAIARQESNLLKKNEAIKARLLASARQGLVLAEEQRRIANKQAELSRQDAEFERAEADFQREEAYFRSQQALVTELQGNISKASAISQTDNSSLLILKLAEEDRKRWITENCSDTTVKTPDQCTYDNPLLEIILISHAETGANNDLSERNILDVNSEEILTQIDNNNENSIIQNANELAEQNKELEQQTTIYDFWSRLYNADNLYYTGDTENGMIEYFDLRRTLPETTNNLATALTIISMGRRKALLTRLFYHAIAPDRTDTAEQADAADQTGDMMQLINLLRTPEEESLYKAIHYELGYDLSLYEVCSAWNDWNSESLPKDCISSLEQAAAEMKKMEAEMEEQPPTDQNGEPLQKD